MAFSSVKEHADKAELPVSNRKEPVALQLYEQMLLLRNDEELIFKCRS